MTTKIDFTDAKLSALPLKAERYIVWDASEPGFGLRITPNDIKTFVLVRRPLGSKNTTTVTVARFNGRNLNAARLEVAKIDAMLRAGANPADERRKAGKDTFEAMAEAYIEAELKDKRQGGQVEAYLRREWLGQIATTTRAQVSKLPARWTWTTTWANGAQPCLRNRPAKFITRAEIVTRLDAIKAEPKSAKGRGRKAARGPWAARHALDAIRRVFAWAAAGHRYGVETSPAAGLNNDVIGLKAKALKRRRVLDDDELRAVWKAAGELGAFGIGVKLLMLTAARRDDVFAATYPEVKSLDGNAARIEVPPERYKTGETTGEPFEVMLSPTAVALVKSLPRYKHCPFLFSNDGHRMLSSFSKPKAKLDEISGVTNWVLHDLRRTARGRMRKLKVPPHVCEQVLGHIVGGIEGVYDVADWRDEKIDALLRWEQALLAIVEPERRAKAA